MSEKKKPSRKTILLERLFDPDIERVNEALNAIKEEGDKDFVIPLMDAALHNVENEASDNILKMLSQLKDSAAIEQFMHHFTEEKYSDLHAEFLAIIWHGNYPVHAHLESAVKLGLEGTFQAAFECLTILENAEGPFPEEQLLESQLMCKQFLADNKEHPNRVLIEQILEFLNEVHGKQ